MMREIPEFEPGDPLLAEQLTAIVEGVRALMAEQGALSVDRRPGRAMRCFTRAGTAIARYDAEGLPACVGSEVLWQLGPHVSILEGSPVEGLDVALADAQTFGVVCGLHSDIAWERRGDDPTSSTLAATSMTYAAAPWQEALENEEGEIVEWYYHGSGQAGAVLPAATAHGHKQAAVTMWPMPQAPTLIGKQSFYAGGCLALLPAPDAAQVLASNYGGYYTADRTFSPVHHEWHARLDRFGRLIITASNFIP